MLFTSKPTPSSLLMTHPREAEASAPAVRTKNIALVHEMTADVMCKRTEDVFVHKQTLYNKSVCEGIEAGGTDPDEILELPRWSKTGYLEEESSIILQSIIYLLQETGVSQYTNVLLKAESSL